MAHETVSRALFEQDVAHITAVVAQRLKLVIHSKQWPVLDVTIEHTQPLRLKFICDDWDDTPPSLALLNVDGTPFSGALPGGSIFNSSAHPSTGRTFICMRGVREYHTHPSHVNEGWGNYRGQDGMSVFGILMQVKDAWRKIAR